MKEHEKIENATQTTLRNITWGSMNVEPASDAMLRIVAIAKAWDKEYGAYYRTLENAKPKPEGNVEIEMHQCKKCESTITIKEDGTGPHAYKMICGKCGGFIKWC